MLIILILASDNEYYSQMQNLWKIYMNTHEKIKSYFIKYNSEIDEEVIINDSTIFIKGTESYVPGCLDKTIKAIEYLLNKNVVFDYIFRTNLSSVVRLDKFYELLNDNIECAGVIGHIGDDKFISGAGMLFSKKTCLNLIQNKSTLNYNLLDDVSIGKFLNKQKYELIPLTRFEAYNYEDNVDLITHEMIADYYHFRCKSDNNHSTTIKLMNKIINILYKKLV